MLKLHDYFLSPTHKITIQLVGVGGTGSHILNNLARIHKVLKKLNHPGITVQAWDNDIIEENNIGRQLFYSQDINKNKCSTLVSRINRSYGLDWDAVDDYFFVQDGNANVIITCVDKIDLRLDLCNFQFNYGQARSRDVQNFLWIDIGNKKMSGQIIFVDVYNRSLTPIELFPDLVLAEENQSPGCNIIDSLNAQELFINEFMANIAADALYRILRTGEIKHNIIYADLENYNIQTQFVNKEVKKLDNAMIND